MNHSNETNLKRICSIRDIIQNQYQNHSIPSLSYTMGAEGSAARQARGPSAAARADSGAERCG